MGTLLIPGHTEFATPKAETLESVTLEIQRRIQTMVRLARTKCCDLARCKAAIFLEQANGINADRQSPDAYLNDVTLMGIAVHAEEEFFKLKPERSLRTLLDRRYELLANSVI